MAERILIGLRSLNRGVAIITGVMFLACAALVLVDIVLRRLGNSLGGTDEISGYVMAIGTAWGMAYALLELSHVRIDFLRSNTSTKWKAVFDLVSMFTLASTVSIIAVQCWQVVAATLKNNSHANTPLETPLALVQVPWFAGWIWFAIMAWLTFIAAMALVAKGEFQKAESFTGVFPEVEGA
ncbi:TRAP transporter small permease subunit [Ahrensia sp. R2A130]|uniref:TRAP transporter small permease subunit n=1 Tax=Ahrensia sp. R2A130 TaxID=744979 RepID=UPI0001E0D0DE|nr:TRAP transporter small permease subunit [Ahrensia sp. R2A130]EFL89255.1 putative trap transporter, transmembrane protein [Ahrensia sp. R2A130]